MSARRRARARGGSARERAAPEVKQSKYKVKQLIDLTSKLELEDAAYARRGARRQGGDESAQAVREGGASEASRGGSRRGGRRGEGLRGVPAGEPGKGEARGDG